MLAVSEFPCKPFSVLRCRDLKAHLTGNTARGCQEQFLFIFTISLCLHNL